MHTRKFADSFQPFNTAKRKKYFSMSKPVKKGHLVLRKKKGRADTIDAYAAARLRQRRALLGFSQEKLADAVGVTFQQVQKYENGSNRISASRLFQFSKILNVDPNYFFENLPKAGPLAYSGLSDQKQDSLSANGDVMEQKETLELIRIYYSIKNPRLRKNLFKFVRSMAETLKAQDN